jgi:hypothetical protein
MQIEKLSARMRPTAKLNTDILHPTPDKNDLNYT